MRGFVEVWRVYLRKSLPLPGNSNCCSRFRFYGTHYTIAERDLIVAENKERIARLLEMSPSSAEELLRKNPTVGKQKTKNLEQVPKILKKYGFPPISLVAAPTLLTVPPAYLENQILIFKESGIDCKNLQLLQGFQQKMKVRITTLKKERILPRRANVVARYVKSLGIQKRHIPFVKRFVPLDVENKHLREIRASLLVPYLALLLNCDVVVSQEIIKRYPKVISRSFRWIKEVVQILKQDFELDDAKIQKHGYLLLVPPDNLRRIHNSIKTVAGIPLLTLVSSRPKALTQTAETLKQIESDCHKHGIPFEVLSKCSLVFTLSESTVRQRLEELEQCPQLQVFKGHPSVMRLICSQTAVKKRLQEQTGHVLSLSALCYSKHYERVVHDRGRWNGSDILTFLRARIPGKTLAEFRHKLKQNPNWLSFSLVNIKEVLDFLQLEEKVDNSIIFKALPIVLYPLEKVKLAFEETINSGEAQRTDIYFLSMVLYIMEKISHFNGDGVWSEEIESALPDFDLDGGEDIDDIGNVDLDVELDADDLDGIPYEENDEEELTRRQ